MKELIYLAGPYSNGSPEANTRKAIEWADTLLAGRYYPFVPHLTHFWHLWSPKGYEDWMDYDFHFLEVCQALVRIPGISGGADREVKRAVVKGIPVIFRSTAAQAVAELDKWFKKK